MVSRGSNPRLLGLWHSTPTNYASVGRQCSFFPWPSAYEPVSDDTEYALYRRIIRSFSVSLLRDAELLTDVISIFHNATDIRYESRDM
jgi:hypothetical protein